MTHEPHAYGQLPEAMPGVTRLWLDVILCALDELTDKQRFKAESFRAALEWFTWGGRHGLADVALVCHLGGVAPARVYLLVAARLLTAGAESARVAEISRLLGEGQRLEEIK